MQDTVFVAYHQGGITIYGSKAAMEKGVKATATAYGYKMVAHIDTGLEFRQRYVDRFGNKALIVKRHEVIN